MRDEKKLKLQLERAIFHLKNKVEPKGLEPILANEHISKTGIINSMYAIQRIGSTKFTFKCPYILIKIKNDELTFTELNQVQAVLYFDNFGKSYPLEE